MLKQLPLLFFLFFTYTGYGQKEKLDTVQLNLTTISIDSTQKGGRDIGDFIVRKYQHTGYYVDIHYIVDTVSKTLLKCGYYEYYSGNQGETELRKAIFYYDKRTFLLTKLSTVSKGNERALGKLYFEHQNNKVVGLQSSPANKSWDLNRVQDVTNEFLLDFEGIDDLIERRKNRR